MAENHLVSKAFLKSLSAKFAEKMELKATDDLKKPNYVLALRTEHAVVAGNHSTSIAAPAAKQGKSKGKKVAAAADLPEENFLEISFTDASLLGKELKTMIKEFSDDLIEPFVEYFLK